MPSSDVFPLKLTTFERYMLTDDRAEYPMAFVVRVDLRGQVHRDAFELALEEALSRHPMLKARPEGLGHRMRWVLRDETEVPIAWVDDLRNVECPESRGPDPRQEPGLRIWIAQGPARAAVMAQFHHACVDGIGALKFLGDLLAGYGIRTAGDGPRPEFLPLDPTLLAGRGCLDFEPPEPISWGRAVRGFVRESLKFLASWPRPIEFSEPVPPDERTRFPSQTTFSLKAPEAQTLRQQARQQSVTLNDVMLHDLFVALRAWNERHGRNPETGRLRINMPTALPAAGARRMPAANVLGYAFLTLSSRECVPGDELLQRVGRITRAIRRWNMGTMFVRALGMADRIPLVLRLGSRLSPCVATTSFSNLGDVSRRFAARFPRSNGLPLAGNVLIERVVGAPPTRPGTPIAFALLALAGEINVTMQTAPHVVSVTQGQAFMESFEAVIRRRLGEDSTA